jgi:hypothetical protein
LIEFIVVFVVAREIIRDPNFKSFFVFCFLFSVWLTFSPFLKTLKPPIIHLMMENLQRKIFFTNILLCCAIATTALVQATPEHEKGVQELT